MSWDDALRKRQQAQPQVHCSNCQILIGEGHIEKIAYPSENGVICERCAMDNAIRIDTAERGWKERITWVGR